MRPLFRENFSDCTALQQGRLGEAFRALPLEEQRRHAQRVVEWALARQRRKLLRLSIITDRRCPPDIVRHWRRKSEWGITVDDYEWAANWILKAYALGFAVFHGSGSMGHPCEES